MLFGEYVVKTTYEYKLIFDAADRIELISALNQVKDDLHTLPPSLENLRTFLRGGCFKLMKEEKV